MASLDPPARSSAYQLSLTVEDVLDPAASASLETGSENDSGTSIPDSDKALRSLPLYCHRPLDATRKSVRLLEVHAAPDYEPVTCMLSHHDLERCPSYVALSYTWDQTGKRRYIQCDEAKFEVGENLWNFLREFRKRNTFQQYHNSNPMSAVCRLWVDAICIDQNDLKERNHQVGQMRDIYTQAESVIVWLGLSYGREELAFLLARYPLLLNVQELRSELVSLLNKPYFTRVWVVQEFVLGKSVVIWCGELYADEVAFDSIWRGQQDLQGPNKYLEAIFQTHGWPLFKYRRDFQQTRGYPRAPQAARNKDAAPSSFQLCDLLRSFHSSQSSEVYDKVYGFLGLASEASDTAQPIRPDYSKSPVELLVDVLRNQCHEKPVKGNQDNYELVTFLRRMLRVSRIDFTRYVLQNAPSMESYIYVLAASDFIIASVAIISTIVEVGSFQHIEDTSHPDAWTHMFRSSTHPRQLSRSSNPVLESIIVRPETALALDFDNCHDSQGQYRWRTEDICDIMIQKSTRSIVNSLVFDERRPLKPDVCDVSMANLPPNETFETAAIRESLLRSLIGAAEMHFAARRDYVTWRDYHYFRRYASFVGTNNTYGVLCTDGSFTDKGITAGDLVCIFADAQGSDKAMIITPPKPGAAKFTIVGFAVVATPKLDKKPASAVWSLRDVFRKAEPTYVAPSREEHQLAEQSIITMCFHCHLTDLLELSRCQILIHSQLDRLLEQSLRDGPDDVVHKCHLGTGEHEVLEFGL